MTIDDLPQRLREARLKAGLSQSQLAERAGVALQSLQRLEHGRSPDPRLSNVVALAHALGVTVDSLVADDRPG